MEEKIISSQNLASRRWKEKNKERNKYLTNRSKARGFIRNDSTLEDLEELRHLICEREDLLKSQSTETELE